jgi:GNAT-like C-terminal domain/N-acyltransferase N-terminal domain
VRGDQSADVVESRSVHPRNGILWPVLPDDAEVADWLRRLGADPLDAAQLLAARPGPERLDELTATRDALVAGIGVVDRELPWPDEADTDTYFYAWVLLDALPAIRGYHEKLDIPDDVSWHSLADFGLQLARYRRLRGRGGLASSDWLTLHFRGLLYRLGRLQFQRLAGLAPSPTGELLAGDARGAGHGQRPPARAAAEAARASGQPDTGSALSVHITADQPLTPRACDDSFAAAARFFGRYYAEEEYRWGVCDSWLLDDQLARYLPPESNILLFQRRFEVPEGTEAAEADLTVLKYVFDRPAEPLRDGDLDALPQVTTLQRAVVGHLRDGGHWWSRSGWCRLAWAE